MRMEDEIKQETKRYEKLTINKAQAESDKIELMRDLATYEADVCE